MTINLSPRDQAIVAAHSNGVLLKDIAPLVNMTPKGVLSACRRLGLAKRAKSKYSDDFVAELITAYRSGQSYSQIGIAFGISRNKAAGILNRAGVLMGRPTRIPKPRKPKNSNTNRFFASPRVRALPFAARAADVVPLNIPFLDRKPNQCAYLYGDDPRTMTCCGHEAYGTGSWCLAHAMIVYRPAEARHRAPSPR